MVKHNQKLTKEQFHDIKDKGSYYLIYQGLQKTSLNAHEQNARKYYANIQGKLNKTSEKYKFLLNLN